MHRSRDAAGQDYPYGLYRWTGFPIVSPLVDPSSAYWQKWACKNPDGFSRPYPPNWQDAAYQYVTLWAMDQTLNKRLLVADVEVYVERGEMCRS